MKTAIFGGTFNPVHHGHLSIAKAVLESTEYERILFIPANIRPNKEYEDPGVKLRLRMLSGAIAYEPRFGLSDCEIRRSGISYSIDTIRYLVSSGMVEACPGLIIGDDLVEGFHTWKEPENLLAECRIIIARRLPEGRVEVPFDHLYINNEVIAVSSSLVRNLIERGEAWDHLVPGAARETIEEYGLYGFRAHRG